MKKLITAGFVVIFVLAIAIQPTNAQDNAPSFGVMGGLNLANLSFEGPEESDLAVKFGVGGILLYPLSEVLDLQAEVMYLLKGNKDDDLDTKVNLAYLSVPVMGRYNLGSGDMSPYVIAGPEFGFLLSADVEFAGEEIDIKDDLKSIDLGFNVGAGVSMNSGSMPMFAEVRYSLGLSNIDDDPDSDESVKTTGIQAFVGIMF